MARYDVELMLVQTATFGVEAEDISQVEEAMKPMTVDDLLRKGEDIGWVTRGIEVRVTEAELTEEELTEEEL